MTQRRNRVVWTIQALLALVFLFAGGMKLALPVAQLTQQMPLPGWFVRFLGVAEVSGALGLILPGLLHIRPLLTPLAAMGLVIIMIGAVVISAIHMGIGAAIAPVIVGVLLVVVAYNRSGTRAQSGRDACLA